MPGRRARPNPCGLVIGCRYDPSTIWTKGDHPHTTVRRQCGDSNAGACVPEARRPINRRRYNALSVRTETAERTISVWPHRTANSAPLVAFHTRAVPSKEVVTICRASRLKAAELRHKRWPARTARRRSRPTAWSMAREETSKSTASRVTAGAARAKDMEGAKTEPAAAPILCSASRLLSIASRPLNCAIVGT